jgi:hypothetical protein
MVAKVALFPSFSGLTFPIITQTLLHTQYITQTFHIFGLHAGAISLT